MRGLECTTQPCGLACKGAANFDFLHVYSTMQTGVVNLTSPSSADAPQFNHEWETKTQPHNQMLSHRSLGHRHGRGHHADTRGLPSLPTTEQEASSSSRHVTGSKRKHRPSSLSEQGAFMGGASHQQKHFCHYRSPSPPPPVAPTTTTMHTRPSAQPGSRHRPVPKEVGPSLPRADGATRLFETETQRKVGRGKSTRVRFEGAQL